LVGSDLSSAIERQVDAFTNADSSDASEQESIGIQGVCPAQFLLESSVIFRRQDSGKILRARRKICANYETGWDEMALAGQIIQQTAETDQVLFAAVVAQRWILLT
jgi:hypothetical protein